MDKSISRKYFNDHSEHWDETPRSTEKLQAMADMLEISPHDRVLDVGTGTGIFLPYLSAKLDGDSLIVCVDFAINMLTIARQKVLNEKILYVCSEIENVNFYGEVFDASVCYSTFPHFHNKEQSLKNIHHLLKPGGTLYICHTASKEVINEIHRRIPDLQDHLIPGNKVMKNLIKTAGFKEVEIMDEEQFYLIRAEK